MFQSQALSVLQDFIMEANTMNPDQTTPKKGVEQSLIRLLPRRVRSILIWVYIVSNKGYLRAIVDMRVDGKRFYHGSKHYEP